MSSLTHQNIAKPYVKKILVIMDELAKIHDIYLIANVSSHHNQLLIMAQNPSHTKSSSRVSHSQSNNIWHLSVVKMTTNL